MNITPTLARLAWQYGSERALAITEGRDEATQADIARWRGIGGTAWEPPPRDAWMPRPETVARHRAETAGQERATDDRARRMADLYRAGVEVEHLAERFGMRDREVVRVLNAEGIRVRKSTPGPSHCRPDET